MLEISYFGALAAGVLSFFTPCVLPMVPFYLSYMGGLSIAELRGDGEIAPGAQKRLFVSALFFGLGVTAIFMMLGMGATALGQLFSQYLQPLSYVAAAILVVFGLHFLGVIRVPLLYRDPRIDALLRTRFYPIQINLHGDIEIVDTDGEALTEKKAMR